MALIQQAIATLGGTLEEKLSAIETAVKGLGTSLETKLALIGSALSNGFADEKTALALVQTALDALKTQLGGVDDNLLKAINNVSTAFGSLLTSGTVDMATALANILSAIQGQPDYAATLAAIQQAIAALVALQA